MATAMPKASDAQAASGGDAVVVILSKASESAMSDKGFAISLCEKNVA